MTNWQTANIPTWFSRIYWALWNSVVAGWDDQVVTWDAVAEHDWKTQNSGAWYTKN